MHQHKRWTQIKHFRKIHKPRSKMGFEGEKKCFWEFASVPALMSRTDNGLSRLFECLLWQDPLQSNCSRVNGGSPPPPSSLSLLSFLLSYLPLSFRVYIKHVSVKQNSDRKGEQASPLNPKGLGQSYPLS